MKNIIKKILSVLMAAIFVFGAMPLGGIDFAEIAKLFAVEADALSAYISPGSKIYGDFYYHEVSREDSMGEMLEGVEIRKYMGNDTHVEIPAYIDGKPVVAIAHSAFNPDPLSSSEEELNESRSETTSLIYVANPDAVWLESVTIPETVEYIGDRAFRNCVCLEEVIIQGENLREISDYAFANTNLTEISLPKSVCLVGSYCFLNSKITDMVFGKNDYNYFEMGHRAFANAQVRHLTIESDGVEFHAGVFMGSLVNTVVFEGSVAVFADGVLPKSNNPVQKIVFKSDFPEEVMRLLVIDYGYYYYAESGYVYFSRKAEVSGTVHKTDEYSYTLDDKEYATIVDYFGLSGIVEVPEIIDGYVVNKIGDHAFKNYSEYNKITGETVLLSYVKLPSSIKEIGNFAFANNSYLQTVEISSGTQKIGMSAFQGCSVFSKIELPASVKEIGEFAFMDTRLQTFSAKGIETISESMFENCTYLSSVTLPQEMESIGAYAFRGCTNLVNINIPDGITVIEPYTFSECSRLSIVTLPESIREIGAFAFDRCTVLKSVTNTKYIETLGLKSFYKTGVEEFDFSSVKGEIPEYCFASSSLGGEVVIPSTVEKIGTWAFHSTNMAKLVISEGVKEIGVSSFASNGQLKEVSIPGTIEEIPASAFNNCPIEKLELNEGLKYIRTLAFLKCNLDELTIPESVELIEQEAFSQGMVRTLNYNAINCKVLNSSGGTASASPFRNGNVLAINIGSKVESIPDRLLYDTQIKTLTVPENVKSIGSFAFGSCDYLTQVNLSDKLEYLGSSSFYGCRALTEFTIPKGVTTYYASTLLGCSALETIYFNAANCKLEGLGSAPRGHYVPKSPFCELTALTSFVLGEGVVTVPDSLCAFLTSVTEVTIPSTVTDIGVGSFYNCGFETVALPPALESIDSYAFAYCESLTAIEFPETLRIINNGAFARCTTLEAIEIPENVVYLGDEVFNSCYALKTAVVSGSINTIPARTFNLCTALEEIYISDSVVRIGEGAFNSCTALVKVRMSPNVTYIPDECFYDCKELSEFIWDSDSKLIGKLAFGNCISLKEFNFIGIEKLYENSFHNSGISVVTLGEAKNEEAAKLQEIEAQSFMECENLEALGVGGNVSTIKTQAFANCTNLETAVIADSVTEIAPDAFDGCDNLTIYCSENSYAYSYAQEQGIPVSTFVIAAIPNQTYTGSKIEPEVSVSLSGKSLSEESDFGVSYENNVNAGKADVKVKGKGVYKMFASKANFTIVTKNISTLSVSPILEQDYTGEAVTPEITVVYGTAVLREGVDYTLAYSDNVEEGTAKIKVTGIGNYSDSLETSFQITELTPSQSFLNRVITFFTSMFARIRSFFAGIFR